MKILHTADAHLGARFRMLGKKGDEQRRQLLKTFERIGELAIDEGVDVFVVAGDLFDSNLPSPQSIDCAKSVLMRVADSGARVFVIPGTHDCFDPASAWRTIDVSRPDGRIVVFTDKTEPVAVPELNLTVCGLVFDSKKAPPGVMARLRRGSQSGVHLGIVHGSLAIPGIVEGEADDALVITADEAAASGMNYLALGHWHSFCEKRFGDVVACYPGAPELIAVDQKGAGQVALVEIDGDGGVRVEPITVGARRFESLEIPMDTTGSVADVATRIREKTDPDLVLDVELTGLCSYDTEVDTEKLGSELQDGFFRLRIRDRSHPRLGDVEMSKLPETTVAGKFARIMAERIGEASEDNKPVLEEALRLGVALLEGKKVLG